MSRLTALDGLLTFAVLAVILHHNGPHDIAYSFNPGGLGVRLFFVLSGFLITGILLEARGAGGRTGRGQVLRAFYVRRALRILPAFYAVLALGMVLEPQIRRDWLWHATYQTNHYTAVLGHWPRAISHAWSLAVEEQFYLAWPLVVLFTPQRWVGRAIVTSFVIGPIAVSLLPRESARWVESQGWAPAGVVAVGSILLASLSWHLFEEPLNRLKRHWPYLPPRPQATPAHATTP